MIKNPDLELMLLTDESLLGGQSFKIEFDYKIRQAVKITPIGLPGRVLAMQLDGSGKQYLVRYFENSEPRSEWLFSDELEPVND